jgi:hypothetical protein
MLELVLVLMVVLELEQEVNEIHEKIMSFTLLTLSILSSWC